MSTARHQLYIGGYEWLDRGGSEKGPSFCGNVVRVQFDAAYLLKNAELKKYTSASSTLPLRRRRKKDVKNQESNVFGESDGFGGFDPGFGSGFGETTTETTKTTTTTEPAIEWGGQPIMAHPDNLGLYTGPNNVTSLSTGPNSCVYSGL